MNISVALDLGNECLMLILILSAPLLLMGLFVGLIVGVFQAVTQIHEMTLTFIPKIASIFGLLVVLLPWMTIRLVEYTIGLFNMFPTLMK
ncbi:MAG: flagellar biosynthesis protein FliQ [Chitinivibrionia bacterium]|jgi:flagellar biosynthetic protein FliQ|nr:flagellar biosynthesis protein FliQ [Chitinivibrionia bacterium]